MFFRSRRPGAPHDNPLAAGHRRARTDGYAAAETQQLQNRRQSARRVTRTWNAWRAAEGRDRAGRYEAFVAALIEEETAAAEVERVTEPSHAGCVTTTNLLTG
jgi:hypothetical protein